MELHHPIMSKLWDLGGQTKRKRKKDIGVTSLWTDLDKFGIKYTSFLFLKNNVMLEAQIKNDEIKK